MTRNLETRLQRLEQRQQAAAETDAQWWHRRYGLTLERVQEITRIIVKADALVSKQAVSTEKPSAPLAVITPKADAQVNKQEVNSRVNSGKPSPPPADFTPNECEVWAIIAEELASEDV
jgi:hypothetical protein